MPTADEIRYMVQHPGPDREFAVWAKEKKIKMRIEMFPHHIIHAECIGGEIDLLVNRRTTIGFSRSAWRFVDGESCIGRCVAMVDDAEYEALMALKAALPKTRFGDGYDPGHVERINRLTRRF